MVQGLLIRSTDDKVCLIYTFFVSAFHARQNEIYRDNERGSDINERVRCFHTNQFQTYHSVIWNWKNERKKWRNGSFVTLNPRAGNWLRTLTSGWNRIQQYVAFFYFWTRRYDTTGWKWLRSNELITCFPWVTFTLQIYIIINYIKLW